MKDFFISFNRADRERARWIAWTLEEAGYTVEFQEWDFRPGENFVLKMQNAAVDTRCTLAVLSDDYLKAEFTQPEWAAAFVQDPRGEQRRLIPVRVALCSPPGLFTAMIYVDLVGLAEQEAKAALLRGVSAERAKPAQAPAFHAAAPAGVRIDTTRLPTPGEHFVGRQAELARLDDAWADPQVNVLSIVAFGGVGKSALVFRWLERLRRDNWRGATRVFAWSFYSQGTHERLASADAFIDFALRWCGDPDPTLRSPRDRGIRLAELIRKQRTLLILDGLEPLQHPPTALAGGAKAAGRLKDPGVAALLKTLAQANDGLCVVTTRERVAELAPHEHEGGAARRLEPESLSPEDGAELLRQLEVKGKPEELQAATKEYAGHALTLTLLGSYLRDACQGDVRRCGEIPLGEADRLESGGHAFRVIVAYEKWLGEGAELTILRLLGLFDRPAAGALVAALRAAPPIVGLTEPLHALSKQAWELALTTLRRRGLLGGRDAHDPEALDAHPLVRAYFAERLEQERPDAWRAGHLRLYEHLCRAAPDQPDTFEQMLPLFQAVIHGCRAGRVQEALDAVFWRRIQRGGEFHSTRKLGAYGAEMAALAGFFERPWDRPSPQLTAKSAALVLNSAGMALFSGGRLREALQPMRDSLDACNEQQDWVGAAVCAANMSQLTLTLGDTKQAMVYGQWSVEFADLADDAFARTAFPTALADALHQAGERDEATALFREAEARQAVRQPEYPQLYSLQGYRYCDLLLSLAEPDDGSALDGVCGAPPRAWCYREACRCVRDRARRTLGWALEELRGSGSLLSVAFDYLALGRSHLGLALTAYVVLATPIATSPCTDAYASEAYVKVSEGLCRAIECLRESGHEDALPHGLIARAVFHRLRAARAATAADAHTARAAAAADLTEALDIATRGEMRLHLADTHLEWTRLHLDQGEIEEARQHHNEARQLVAETGYHRRDREVNYLARRIEEAK